MWVHWVLYNLSPGIDGLAENTVPVGARVGLNDFKHSAYNGPCPPVGRHRYFHKLYALDTTLPPTLTTKAKLEGAMKGHVLAQAELMATYQKGDP